MSALQTNVQTQLTDQQRSAQACSADDSADGKITVGSRDPVSSTDNIADNIADNSAHGGADTQITAVGSADSSADNTADNSAHGGADTQITAVSSADNIVLTTAPTATASTATVPV